MSIRLDANETIAFERQLEKIKAKAYMVDYPSTDVRRFLPTVAGGADWAETLTYEQFENVGAANWIADYGDDVEIADVKGKKFSIFPKAFGVGYMYNMQEIKAAIHMNKPLKQMKANSAKQAFKVKERDIAMFARGRAEEDAGIVGFVYNPNITVSNAPTGTWSAATAAQMIGDITFALKTIKVLTKEVEAANTVLMGTDSMAMIESTQLPGTNSTVLDFVKRNNPGVSFEATYLLDGVDPKPSTPTVAGPTNILIAYDKNPDKLTLEIPLDFTQEAPERKGFVHTIDTHGRIAGVFIYKPLSVHIIEGL